MTLVLNSVEPQYLTLRPEPSPPEHRVHHHSYSWGETTPWFQRCMTTENNCMEIFMFPLVQENFFTKTFRVEKTLHFGCKHTTLRSTFISKKTREVTYSPSRIGPASKVTMSALQSFIRPLSSSMRAMIPSRMETSNLKNTMATPDRQRKRVCCCKSQLLKHKRTAGRERSIVL